jgi:hypothetical protein
MGNVYALCTTTMLLDGWLAGLRGDSSLDVSRKMFSSCSARLFMCGHALITTFSIISGLEGFKINLHAES